MIYQSLFLLSNTAFDFNSFSVLFCELSFLDLDNDEWIMENIVISDNNIENILFNMLYFYRNIRRSTVINFYNTTIILILYNCTIVCKNSRI